MLKFHSCTMLFFHISIYISVQAAWAAPNSFSRNVLLDGSTKSSISQPDRNIFEDQGELQKRDGKKYVFMHHVRFFFLSISLELKFQFILDRWQ